MKIGLMQPYLFPYLGYFQLMVAVDKYVIYDDVSYIKGGWVNRNNLILNKEKKMFTISLKKASSYKNFNEIEIGDNFSTFLKSIQQNYSKTKYFDPVFTLIESIVHYDNKILSEFTLNSFKEILQYLDITKELIMSSTIKKNIDLKGEDRVIEICKILQGTVYYNAVGGKELYNSNNFKNNGIKLNFLETKFVPYPQTVKDFVPGLSIIDILMNNSSDEVKNLLNNYELVE